MSDKISRTQTLTTPIDAVTETTTSGAIDMQGVSKATWFFTRADHSSGSTDFTVDVSYDGTTWVGYNKLISNATNSNAQGLTRVATVTLAADGSSTAAMDLEHDTFLFMRVVATETTDGTHTAELIREY